MYEDPSFSLSAKGKKQVEQAAYFLKPFGIKYIYSSPATWSRQTAQIIREILGLEEPIFFEADLGEMKILAELHQITKEKWKKLLTKYINLEQDVPGMETWDSVKERMQGVLGELGQKHLSENIVCVSHGSTMKVVLLAFKGESIKKLSTFPFPRGGVYKLDYLSPDRVEYKLVFEPR